MITRFSPIDRMREFGKLSKFFDDMFFDTEDTRKGWIPSVDVRETNRDFTFIVELPGLKQEDIEVEMVGDVLTIRGKREFADEEKRDDYIRIERSYGSFQRSFTLGTPVKSDAITASYKDGVLNVVVPKADEVQPKRIAISSN